MPRSLVRPKGLICDLLFLQVLTALPVEPQFTFSSQSQGEPFPPENCSSMGEGQVKNITSSFNTAKVSHMWLKL